MSKYLLNESTIQDIADAIRDKNGSSTTYTPSEIPQAILDIPTEYSHYPLCFTAEEDNSTIYLTTPSSLDINLMKSLDGVQWSEWTKDSNGTFSTITLDKDDKVYIKGDNTVFADGVNNTHYSQFYMTGKIKASGSIMSLIDSTGKLLSLSGRNYCFCNLFYECTSLISTPDLPATTLENYCYYGMFQYCRNLKRAPDILPAKTLTLCCYCSMFKYCTSLTQAPALPATTLAQYCYQYMFQDCTSLIHAPALPATSIENSCYSAMFYNCTSLITAPNLPATNPKQYCYNSMFYNCISLINVPRLPITSVYGFCYRSMFYGCVNLSSIETAATSWSGSQHSENWLYGVAASGTFTKPSSLTLSTGPDGIPSGWTVVNV